MQLLKNLGVKALGSSGCCCPCPSWHLRGRVGDTSAVKGKIQLFTGCCSCWPYLNLWSASLLALCSLTSPVPCNYPEELESADNLENTYCPYSSQDGIYQLPQYPQQHQLSQFHHLPAHLASNVLSSVHLSPTTATESHTAFLALPGNSGVVTHEASGATQAYVQSHTGGQLLLQQPSGNSGKFQNLLAFCSSGVTKECTETFRMVRSFTDDCDRKKECTYTCTNIYIDIYAAFYLFSSMLFFKSAEWPINLNQKLQHRLHVRESITMWVSQVVPQFCLEWRA